MLRRLVYLLILTLLAPTFTGCTIIRDGNGDGDGDGDVTLEPRTIDVLIMVDLPRGSANLMNAYAEYLTLIEVALLTQNIEIRNTAVAPLYRSQGDGTPLIYGRDDEHAPFPGISETLLFYISDEGRAHLTGELDADGEALAQLGLQLDRKPIYNPLFTPPEVVPYFDEAADGLIVFYFTGSTRRCAYDSAACQLDGQTPARYFTATNEDTGHAAWLSLPGSTGLPPHRIVHIPIASAEGISFDEFATRCLRETNFPANFLDVLEPSSENAYFGLLVQEIRRGGGSAELIDLCTALSGRKDRSAATTAGRIATMLR